MHSICQFGSEGLVIPFLALGSFSLNVVFDRNGTLIDFGHREHNIAGELRSTLGLFFYFSFNHPQTPFSGFLQFFDLLARFFFDLPLHCV